MSLNTSYVVYVEILLCYIVYTLRGNGFSFNTFNTFKPSNDGDGYANIRWLFLCVNVFNSSGFRLVHAGIHPMKRGEGAAAKSIPKSAR